VLPLELRINILIQLMISYANELNVSVEGIKEIREKTKKYSGQMGYSINHCT
jgi:hypothetical protein